MIFHKSCCLRLKLFISFFCLETLNSICSCYDLIKLFVRHVAERFEQRKKIFFTLCRKMKTFVIIVDKSIEICMRRDWQAQVVLCFPELSKLSETSWKAMRITLYCSIWNSRWVSLKYFFLYLPWHRKWLQTLLELNFETRIEMQSKKSSKPQVWYQTLFVEYSSLD